MPEPEEVMTEEVTFTPEDVEAAQRMLARLDPADDAYALATAAGVHRSDVHDRARVRDFHAGMLYGREQKGTEAMHHAADAFSLRDKVARLQSENAELRAVCGPKAECGHYIVQHLNYCKGAK